MLPLRLVLPRSIYSDLKCVNIGVVEYPVLVRIPVLYRLPLSLKSLSILISDIYSAYIIVIVVNIAGYLKLSTDIAIEWFSSNRSVG